MKSKPSGGVQTQPHGDQAVSASDAFRVRFAHQMSGTRRFSLLADETLIQKGIRRVISRTRAPLLSRSGRPDHLRPPDPQDVKG